MIIENDGAIFRGPSRGLPLEIWSEKRQTWLPYEGTTPKPIEWGYEITEEEALRMIEAAGAPPRTIGEDIEIDPWKYDDYDGGREEPRPSVLAHLDLRARRRDGGQTTAGKDSGTLS